MLPLTTRLLENASPLRVRIVARDGLERDSDVMIDQIRTIDNRRLSGELLTMLDHAEMARVEEYLRIVLDLE